MWRNKFQTGPNEAAHGSTNQLGTAEGVATINVNFLQDQLQDIVAMLMCLFLLPEQGPQ